MYSSGTTGVPKCIVHGAGGTLIQHLKELQLHCDIKPGDAVFYFTTTGWMMWNWMVSALALGATLVLFDGSPFHPDPGVLWRIAERERLAVFGTSAKYLSALEKSGYRPAEHVRLPRLASVLSTGSPLAPSSFDFVYENIKEDLQLSSIAGGTDIIACFISGNPMLPVYRGELQCSALGLAVDVFDDGGRPVRGQKGELVCTAPFPSMPVSFWNDPGDAMYRAAYFERFPGVWCHGDYVEMTRAAASSSTAARMPFSIPAACASALRKSTGSWRTSRRSPKPLRWARSGKETCAWCSSFGCSPAIGWTTTWSNEFGLLSGAMPVRDMFQPRSSKLRISPGREAGKLWS